MYCGEVFLIKVALCICVLLFLYGVYLIILPIHKKHTYLKFENMYRTGELFNIYDFDVHWGSDSTTYVCVGEEYVIFGITEEDVNYDGYSVRAVHRRNLYDADMYREDYQRSYGDTLDFAFYILAYRYRRYGKEIVNYYDVSYELGKS
mgnify:CR=1 FL=1